MATIFVGAHSIQKLTFASSSYAVPVGHQFLLFSEDNIISADDLIIQGFPIGSTLTIVNDGTFDQTGDWPQNFANNLGISYEQALDYYGFRAIDFSETGFDGLDLHAIWQSFVSIAGQINEQNMFYQSFMQNSNSVVNTILSIVDISLQSIETFGGINYVYPAYGMTLSTNLFSGENYSYVLRGGYFPEAGGVDAPIGDLLYALNSSHPNLLATMLPGDFVTTFGGNDELHDGNRKDTLEGGTGDDTYILKDDGAADIVITGEGDDSVRGGGAEDRLVLRIDILDEMYDDWQASVPEDIVLIGDALLKPSERIGDDAATSGVPLLGGFWDMDYDGLVGTRLTTGQFYASFRAGAGSNNPEDLSVSYQDFIYSYSYIDQYGDPATNTRSIFSFSFELKDGDLIISVPHGPAVDLSVETIEQHLVTIEDFEDGDFGIHIYEPSVEIGGGDPWYYEDDNDIPDGYNPYFATQFVGNSSQVGDINNDGNYITVLASLDPASTGSIPQTPPQPAPGIDGDEHDNQIDGGAPGELIRAYGGNDTVIANGGDDRVDAGDGNDIVHLGNGADLSIGGLGLDVLFGEAGDDGISGGAGDDQISGGTGKDWLFGDAGNDVITGDSGDDTLEGCEGDDTLDGGTGLDTLYGSAGQDTLSGGGNVDTVNGGDGNDTLLGGDGNDLLNGDGGNDTLHGESGADTLNGGEGDDALFGETGHDALSGGAGADTLSGGDGNDTLNGDADDDTLWGDAGFDLLNGGDGVDTLWGGTGDDALNGDAGNDVLHGEGANDTIHGGDGEDMLWGDAGHDLLFGGGGSDLMWGGAGNDRLDGGIGNDTLNGEGSDDILIGGAGNDTLSGSSGLDRLDGGEGDDTLTGGALEDRFVFSSGYGHDRIMDFAGNDYLVIDGALAADFTGVMSHATQIGADIAFTFGDDVLTLANKTLGVMNAGDFEFV